MEFTKLSDPRIRKPPDMHLRECRGVPVTFRFNGHQGYDYVIVGKNMLHLDSEDTTAERQGALEETNNLLVAL